MASHYVGFRPARTFQFQQYIYICIYMIYNELYIIYLLGNLHGYFPHWAMLENTFKGSILEYFRSSVIWRNTFFFSHTKVVIWQWKIMMLCLQDW